MAGEWARVSKLFAFVGIRRDDLDPILGPSIVNKFRPLLDAYTIREPLHVSLKDAKYTPANAPYILVLDVRRFEINAALNGIPRATCMMAIGRDGQRLVDAANAANTTLAPIHVLDQYLGKFVTARVYFNEQQTYTAGTVDGGDNGGRDNSDWVVLFEGVTAAPTWRFNDQDAGLVLHLAHFTSQLTYSSSLSGSVASGSATPASFQIATFPQAVAGAGLPFTPQGAVAASLAGGPAAQNDFWGYNLPTGPGAKYPAVGLKGFLNNLANTDQFQWSAFAVADGAQSSTCIVPQGGLLKNNRALSALAKIEPYRFGTLGYAEAVAAWNKLATLYTPNQDGSGIDRSSLAKVPEYATLGYQYAVPLPFYLNDTVLGATSIGKGFAGDIAGATFQQLTSASFWELLTGRYASRYQLAFVPTAEGGAVIPAQPLLSKSWQTIYESEISSWDDDMGSPVPVRGVMLTCDRVSTAGAFNAGYQPICAVYDSCEDGVLVTKMLPEWLWSAYRGVGAGIAPERPKMMASAPSALAAVVGTAGAVGKTDPSDIQRSTANRLAKAYWQQERLRYRSLMVACRLRYDIAPGSVISCELPCDRYVRQTNVRDNKSSLVSGMVLNMTISVDCEGETASTNFMIGFPRTEAETKKTNKLFANSHPFWRTVCYGLPWADSTGIRNKLGPNATL